MHRDDLSEDLWLRIWKVPDRAIHLSAQGVLSVQLLAQQFTDEWSAIKQQRGADGDPSQSFLMRIGQRIWSQALFSA